MFYFITIGLLFIDFFIISRFIKKRLYRRLLRLCITLLYLILACFYYEKYNVVEKEYEIVTEYKTIYRYNTDTVYINNYVCTGTYYNATVEQCDSNPLVTASQMYIDTNKLKRFELRWCAVSRNLLKKNGGEYCFGDTIIVSCQTNEYINGEWVIYDTMNERFSCYVDFLMPIGNNKGIGKEEIIIRKK